MSRWISIIPLPPKLLYLEERGRWYNPRDIIKGIYAIYQENTLIYIGQSKYIYDRIYFHRLRYGYIRVKVKFLPNETSRTEMLKLEHKLLQKLHPRDNKRLVLYKATEVEDSK